MEEKNILLTLLGFYTLRFILIRKQIMKKLLHVGSGGIYLDGFINSDNLLWWKSRERKLDLVMDLGEPWLYEDNSIDGIVGMHVFQQLSWRELVVAFREAFRVLKKGGVMRIGCPMVEIMDKDLDYLLGWNNINLFSEDLLRRVLVDRIGFSKFRERGYRRSYLPELAKADNRPNRGTKYYDAVK